MYKQIIVVRADLKMGRGKQVAQGSHACLEAYKKALTQDEEMVAEWESQGMPKIVLKVNSEKELLDLFEKLKRNFQGYPALIKDAGRTQIEPGTITCLGIGPVRETEIDKFVSSLKLL
ncbi:MAG: peptidyl-tRNA hydrolase Pth2 [Candidatus Diapherotrites archaeon]|nr:peptidyl-tRNA hydrolase Pth2 [Candidatus Diapherotrites archaeon]